MCSFLCLLMWSQLFSCLYYKYNWPAVMLFLFHFHRLIPALGFFIWCRFDHPRRSIF
ncbi:hypothetical protein HanPSC8_Chr02g0064521 [Helianthus annuus]|nr:hypothetical protein HanPSC8_Chr02g0064521 [Helianthus annuus]